MRPQLPVSTVEQGAAGPQELAAAHQVAFSLASAAAFYISKYTHNFVYFGGNMEFLPRHEYTSLTALLCSNINVLNFNLLIENNWQ